MHKNSASVFVRFSCLFFSSSLFSLVCCSQTYSPILNSRWHCQLPVSRCCSRCYVLFGLMSCVVVILHEFKPSFERSCWMTLQTFLIMRFSKHTCLTLMKSSTRRIFHFLSLLFCCSSFSFSTTNIIRYNRWSYINNTSFS